MRQATKHMPTLTDPMDADPWAAIDLGYSLSVATGVLDAIASGNLPAWIISHMARAALRVIREPNDCSVADPVVRDALQHAIDGDELDSLDALDALSETLHGESSGHIDDVPRGLVSPTYAGTGERDIAGVEHAIAALAESLHMRQRCRCAGELVCEPCRIIEAISDGLSDAREFLATDRRDGAGS